MPFVPKSRVKVSQVNLIDLVTKVQDLHMDLSTITYHVWGERLYLHLGPEGRYSDRVDGEQYNTVVEKGLVIADYVMFYGSNQPGTNLVVDYASDDRLIASGVVVDDPDAPSVENVVDEEDAQEDEGCCPECKTECMSRARSIRHAQSLSVSSCMKMIQLFGGR
jgi:hypothetical protein